MDFASAAKSAAVGSAAPISNSAAGSAASFKRMEAAIAARLAQTGPRVACAAHRLLGGGAVPLFDVVARFRLFLRAVDDGVLVLGRAIERVEAERRGPGVPHVVPGAGGHDYGEVVLHRVLAPIDVDGALPLLDAEELIPVFV